MFMEEDFLISEQRHRELLSAIKSLSNAVDGKNIDVSFLEGIIPALNSIKDKIEENKQEKGEDLLPMFKEISFNIVKGFTDMEKSLSLIHEKEEKWDFVIERDNTNGLISKVIAVKK